MLKLIIDKKEKEIDQLAQDLNLEPAVLETAALSIGPRGIYRCKQKNFLYIEHKRR